LIRGACFLKKKARSPVLKGFGLDSSAVLKFTGQQYLFSYIILPTHIGVDKGAKREKYAENCTFFFLNKLF